MPPVLLPLVRFLSCAASLFMLGEGSSAPAGRPVPDTREKLGSRQPRPAPRSPTCKAIICGSQCRSISFGCVVLARSQGPDTCEPTTPGVGCGPRDPGPNLTNCEIGVGYRLLVERRQNCTRRTFQRLTAKACQAYRRKNVDRPLDEFDPSEGIHVTHFVERYNREGDAVGGGPVAELQCPPARPRSHGDARTARGRLRP
jgi:hypothetical protein